MTRRWHAAAAAALAAALLAAALLDACSSSGHRDHRATGSPGGPTGSVPGASAAPGPASASGPSGGAASAGSATGSATGAVRPGPGPASSPAGRVSSGRNAGTGSRRAPGSVAVRAPSASVAACRLLTQHLADVALTPLHSTRTADVPSVCAYSATDGKTVINIGDVPLAHGQSAASVVAGELDDRNRTGYRVTRVDVAGRYPAALEDGSPHIARLVWVQRGRNLTLTVSPAGTAAGGRLRQVAASISATLG